MGARNPDRIPIDEWRSGFETVAQMQKGGWKVISKCRTCGLTMAVDLDLIAWRSGANTSLWNRTARCRRLRCEGVVEFQAHIPRVPGYQALSAPWPPMRAPQTDVEPTMAELVRTGRDLSITCAKCVPPPRRLTPTEAAERFGPDTSFKAVREQLRAECKAPDCWISAGLALPPDYVIQAALRNRRL
jgi:hypothetical protein